MLAAMTPALPEPGPSHDIKELFLSYLDFYRAAVADKVSGLSEADLRASRLPSGWSPIELVKHLVCMERRWLVWGFLGQALDDPWADERDGRWHVDDGEPLARLLTALAEVGPATRRIVEASELSALATPGGRFTEGGPTPSLASILFHVLQEYARHAGHLDVARELVDGRVGE
jgi:uncharacterized damage-inducible protein DinB